MQWVFYGLLIYLAACYLGGMYLVLRLTARTRLRRLGMRLLGRGRDAGMGQRSTTTATSVDTRPMRPVPTAWNRAA